MKTDKPDAVENISIGEHSDVQVWSQNCVKSSNFLISKKSVRHPHFACICEGQVTDALWNKQIVDTKLNNFEVKLSKAKRT